MMFSKVVVDVGAGVGGAVERSVRDGEGSVVGDGCVRNGERSVVGDGSVSYVVGGVGSGVTSDGDDGFGDGYGGGLSDDSL